MKALAVTNQQARGKRHSLAYHRAMNFSMATTDTSAPSPLPDELYQQGDVLQFSYRIVAPVVNCKPSRSFAIYYGRGRVIHVWSNTRTDFRVRVDTLRNLEATGLVVANATRDMDAYCSQVLGVNPLPQDTIIPRAREALHCATRDSSSSILFVLAARYGSIAMRMAKSFYVMLPHIVRRFGAVDMLADRLGDAVLNLLAQQPLPVGLADNARLVGGDVGVRAAAALWTEYLCELAAKDLRGIQSLLVAEISRVLSKWILFTFDRATQSSTGEQITYGMIFSRPNGPTASLAFNRAVQRFVLVFDTDKMLLERLVRDRMECGICFAGFEKVRIKVFECSHYTCGDCFKSIHSRICPYCRAPIVAVREVTSYLKMQAYEMMRAEECKQLAENDCDAPVFVLALTSGGEDPASPGYDGDEDGGDEDDPSEPAPRSHAEADNREAELGAMLAQDFDALSL